MSEQGSLSEWEVDILKTLDSIDKQHVRLSHEFPSILDDGWTTSSHVRHILKSKSLPTRQTLRRLTDWGFVELNQQGRIQFFRLSPKGIRALNSDILEPVNRINSANWTGVVSPVQIEQVLNIVSEIEDICENITDNEVRSQIIGLVRALEILIDLPNPPRQGLIALVRDPAFANIVQVATCLAAIVAAIRG